MVTPAAAGAALPPAAVEADAADVGGAVTGMAVAVAAAAVVAVCLVAAGLLLPAVQKASTVASRAKPESEFANKATDERLEEHGDWTYGWRGQRNWQRQYLTT